MNVRNMVVGGVICVGGIVLSVALSDGGRTFLAWGAILFGGIQFVVGLAAASKRPQPSRPDADRPPRPAPDTGKPVMPTAGYSFGPIVGTTSFAAPSVSAFDAALPNLPEAARALIVVLAATTLSPSTIKASEIRTIQTLAGAVLGHSVSEDMLAAVGKALEQEGPSGFLDYLRGKSRAIDQDFKALILRSAHQLLTAGGTKDDGAQGLRHLGAALAVDEKVLADIIHTFGNAAGRDTRP